MTKPRYIVRPGYVTSKSDGQEHFITSEMLIRLHGVRRKDCIVVPCNTVTSRPSFFTEQQMRNMTILQPRYDGDYIFLGDTP